MRIRSFCILLICVTFVSCKTDRQRLESNFESSIPDYLISPGSSKDIGNVSNLVKGVRTLNLRADVAEKIGVVFHFFVIEDKDLLLVDEISGTLTRLSRNGEIIWQIAAQRDDYKIFPSIDEAVLDPFHRHVIVYNDFNVFAYDYNGQSVYVKSRPDFDFFTMLPCSSDDMVYATQGLPSTAVNVLPQQLIWEKNKEIQRSFVNALPIVPRGTLVGGFPRFSVLNGAVHYASIYRDTFYKLNLPTVKPAFTSRFTGTITTNEVMESGRISNKLTYMVENNIPERYSLAADDENIVQTYQRGGRNFFAMIKRRTKKLLVNHQHIQFGEQVFRAPLLYNNGYLLRVVPKYKEEHYQKLSADANQVTDQWMEELRELDEAYDGRGEKVLYLVEI